MEGYISRQELREDLQRQIYNHIHTEYADRLHTHNLSDLRADSMHRTVTDEQIAQWTEGTGGGTVDPSKLLPVKLVSEIIKIPINSEGQSIFTFTASNYIESKCFELVLINDKIHMDFTITNDNTLTLNNSDGLILPDTNLQLIIVYVVGQVVNGTDGNIVVTNISKEHLSEELKLEIDNFSKPYIINQGEELPAAQRVPGKLYFKVTDTQSSTPSGNIKVSPNMGIKIQ